MRREYFCLRGGSAYAKKCKTPLQNRLYGGAARRVCAACAGFALVVLVVCSWGVSDICRPMRAEKILKNIWREKMKVRVFCPPRFIRLFLRKLFR